jgi:hypothetical protein
VVIVDHEEPREVVAEALMGLREVIHKIDEVDIIEKGCVITDGVNLVEKERGGSDAKAEAEFLFHFHGCKVQRNRRPLHKCLLKKLVDCAIFNKFVTQYCISLSWVHVTQVGEAVSGA